MRGGEVAAIPTTLSGAPMTGIHRCRRGTRAYGGCASEAGARRSRRDDQRARAAASGQCDERPRARRRVALHAARRRDLPQRRAAGRADDRHRPGPRPRAADRSELALGALLCGFAVDRAGFALHHVLGQTIVRVCGIPHAETYAALLPVTMDAMRKRAPIRSPRSPRRSEPSPRRSAIASPSWRRTAPARRARGGPGLPRAVPRHRDARAGAPPDDARGGRSGGSEGSSSKQPGDRSQPVRARAGVLSPLRHERGEAAQLPPLHARARRERADVRRRARPDPGRACSSTSASRGSAVSTPACRAR